MARRRRGSPREWPGNGREVSLELGGATRCDGNARASPGRLASAGAKNALVDPHRASGAMGARAAHRVFGAGTSRASQALQVEDVEREVAARTRRGPAMWRRFLAMP